MIPRSKLIAAAIGFVIAAGTIGNASAMTVVKSVTTRTVVGTRTAKIVTHRPNRVFLPVPIVYHAPVFYRAPALVGSPTVVKKVVRVTRWPHVAARHFFTKTVVR